MFNTQQEFHNQAFNNNTATLYVLSPRMIPEQVVRPYVYNFNEDLVDNLSQQEDMLQFFNVRNKHKYQQFAQDSILPNAQGARMDTDDLSYMWSFVLVVDVGASTGNKFTLSTGKNRILATGFFTDEPINPLTIHNTTPTVNPEAFMQFTHGSVIQMHDSISTRGERSNMNVSHDNDCISQMVDHMTPGDLYVMSPADIRECNRGENTEGDMITTYGDKHTSALRSGSVTTPTRLKSPKHQFQEIVYALNSARDHESLQNPTSAITGGGYGDPLADFVDTFDSNLISDSKFTPQMGIDLNKPISIQQLIGQYPNLTVMPFKIPTASEWEVRPQDEVNVHNTMSSMVASTISTLATGSGLSEVSFRYNSSIGNSLDPNGGGAWKVEHVKTIVPTNDAGVKGCFNTFKNRLVLDLWPILRSVVGEFDIMLSHNITGETLVGLQFLDHNTAHGLYETCNRMGGMISPTLGDVSAFNHNSTELQALVDGTAIRTGIGGFYESSRNLIKLNDTQTTQHDDFGMSFNDEIIPQDENHNWNNQQSKTISNTFDNPLF